MGYMTWSTRLGQSSLNATSETRDKASRLVGTNWLGKCIVLSYVCILLASGVIMIMMTLVILFDNFDQLLEATSEHPLQHHHRHAQPPTVPYRIAKHQKCGRAGQSLFRCYASQNCSVWAPHAEGADRLTIHFGKLPGTH